jgi:hypothetical protein
MVAKPQPDGQETVCENEKQHEKMEEQLSSVSAVMV